MRRAGFTLGEMVVVMILGVFAAGGIFLPLLLLLNADADTKLRFVEYRAVGDLAGNFRRQVRQARNVQLAAADTLELQLAAGHQVTFKFADGHLQHIVAQPDQRPRHDLRPLADGTTVRFELPPDGFARMIVERRTRPEAPARVLLIEARIGADLPQEPPA